MIKSQNIIIEKEKYDLLVELINNASEAESAKDMYDYILEMKKVLKI